jgi:hypothetical protein
MSRQLTWRRSGERPYIQWKAKAYDTQSSYSFKVIAGYTGMINKPARLLVLENKEGKKDTEKVVFSGEFENSYVIKELVDSILYITRMLIVDVEEADRFILKLLNDYHKTPQIGTSRFSYVYTL